MTVIH